MKFQENSFNRYLIALLLIAFGINCSRIIDQESRIDVNEEDTNTENEEHSESDGGLLYVNNSTIKYTDEVYKPSIKTVLLYKDDLIFSYPMLQLGSTHKLILRFDELGNKLMDYSYTVIHCNANWQPSELVQFEYMEGFTFGRIINYDFSFNTLQDYIHYSLYFPNFDFKITKSGNYILKVYETDDPDRLVLTKRFVVFEEKFNIEADVRRTNIVKHRKEKQVVQFKVDLQQAAVQNPFRDIKVSITQNLRWDKMITGIKPRFIRQNELIYDSHLINSFYAGKEFRYVDIRSTKFTTDRVKYIENFERTHMFLYPDEVRSYKSYFYNKDINGRFIIDTREGSDGTIESEYVYVHFELEFDQLPTDGNIYVIGSFSNWDIHQDQIMRYDYSYKSYFATLYLKQGYYNYSYVFIKDGTDDFDEGLIEGNSFETENDYLILVYYREMGQRHDDLVAVKHINSLWGDINE